jgi:hypothetical protein
LCLGWVDLYVIIPVHGIGSIKTTRRQITRRKLGFYYTCKFGNIKHLWVIIMWHIFTNNTTTILFPTQLWELLYTYHVIKQCTEKETTSPSNVSLTIKLNYLHDHRNIWLKKNPDIYSYICMIGIKYNFGAVCIV